MLCVGGNKLYTKKRELSMYQYGGTIGPARYPTYELGTDGIKHMMPRPVVKSRPHRFGNKLMTECKWLIELIQDIETLTLKHIAEDTSPTSVMIKEYVKDRKALIRKCLRICNTFFTQMILLGDHDQTAGRIPLHMDTDDHITALFSIGNESMNGKEGETVYIEKSYPDVGVTIKKRIPFSHGNLQIGYYDEVIHGTVQWFEGKRFVMNLSLQKKIYV